MGLDILKDSLYNIIMKYPKITLCPGYKKGIRKESIMKIGDKVHVLVSARVENITVGIVQVAILDLDGNVLCYYDVIEGNVVDRK